MSTINNWLMAFVIALALGSAHLLDGPSAQQETQDVANEVREREACGENGSARWLADGRIQCLTKHGKKAGEPK